MDGEEEEIEEAAKPVGFWTVAIAERRSQPCDLCSLCFVDVHISHHIHIHFNVCVNVCVNV